MRFRLGLPLMAMMSLTSPALAEAPATRAAIEAEYDNYLAPLFLDFHQNPDHLPPAERHPQAHARLQLLTQHTGRRPVVEQAAQG